MSKITRTNDEQQDRKLWLGRVAAQIAALLVAFVTGEDAENGEQVRQAS